MKKFQKIAVLALVGLLSFAFTNEKPARYNVDATESTIVWTGKKVTGAHTGNISVTNGNIEMDGNKVTGGFFEIDMNSMTCTDLSGDMAGKLLGHLKSDDFFGVEKNPTASLKITKAVWQGENNYKVTGDITIKGVTKEIKFPATITEENGKITANSTIVVDRSEFDIRYGSGSFFDNLGDKTIYDDFTLEVSLVAGK